MPVTLDWSGWDTDGAESPAPLPDEPMMEAGNETEEAAPAGAEESAAPLDFPLSAKKSFHVDRQALPSMLAAFKRTCDRFKISYHAGWDGQGRRRVILEGGGGLALSALSVKLEFTPALEEAILNELKQRPQ